MPTAAMSPATEPFEDTPRVRRALPHEALAARLLLPELVLAGLPYRTFVATDDEGSRIIGAAAVVVAPAHRLNGRCPAEVQVIHSRSGRGVEAALWKCLLDEARPTGCGLVCQRWVVDEADAPPASLGFEVVHRKYEFLATIQSSIDTLEPIMNRLRRRGRLPADARVVSFRQADAAIITAVTALYLRHFPGTAEQFVASLREDAAEPFDLGISTISMLGDVVTGFMLGRVLKDESIYDVYWKAVDERHRNGWSNVWSMYESAIQLKPMGIQWTRYRALTQNRDTQQLIEHFGGRLAKVETRYGTNPRPVASDSATVASPR